MFTEVSLRACVELATSATEHKITLSLLDRASSW